MLEPKLASNISECPVIEQLWNLAGIENKILISHSDIGPYIHVVCPPGHHVVGPGMITCLEGGVWDDVTLPTCSASSLFDVPESTMILISIMAGCGALIIITFTFILAHLIFFQKCPIFPGRSVDHLNRSIESDASMTYHHVNKRFHTLSLPVYPTRNGRPLNSDTRHHMASNPGSEVAMVTENDMFVNYIYKLDDQTHQQQSTSNRSPTDGSPASQNSLRVPEQLQANENRTEF